MASPVPSSFQHLAECPVCYQLYKQPQMLQCLHVICQACVQLLADYNCVECPVCRGCSRIGSIKPDINKKLLVEAFIKDNEERAKQPEIGGVLPEGQLSTLLKADSCESCKKGVNLSSQCDSCSVFLCADCEKIHSHATEHHTLKPVCSIVDSLKSDISKTLESLTGCSQVLESELKADEKYLEGIEHVWRKAAAEVDKQVTLFIDLIKHQNAVSLEETRLKLQEFTKAQLQKISDLNQTKRAIAKNVNALKYLVAELDEQNDIRTAICQTKYVFDRIKSDTVILEEELRKILEAPIQTLPIFKLKAPVTPPEAIECQAEVIASEHPAVVNQEATAELSVSLNSQDRFPCNVRPVVEHPHSSDTSLHESLNKPEDNGTCKEAPAEISQLATSTTGENPQDIQTSTIDNDLQNNTITATDNNGTETTNDAHCHMESPSINKSHTKIKEINRKPSEHSRILLYQDELWCTTSNNNMLDIYNLNCELLHSLKLQGIGRLRAIVHSSSEHRIIAASLDGLHEYKSDGKHLHCLSSGSFIDLTEHKCNWVYAMEYATGDVCVFKRREKGFRFSIGLPWTKYYKVSLGNYVGDVYDRLDIFQSTDLFESCMCLNVSSWYNHKLYQFTTWGDDLILNVGDDSLLCRTYSKSDLRFYDFSSLKPQIESGNELDDTLSGKRSTAIMDVAVNESCSLVWVLTANKLMKFSYA